jgi:hypothetical protein
VIANRTEADLPDLPEHALLRALKDMNLDTGDFVIFGSAPLLAHGLRSDIRDLDVLARNGVWAEVAAKGELAFGDETGDEIREFHGGRIQFSQRWISGDFNTDHLIEGATIVAGLPFAPLVEVLCYKERLDRPKDQDDIAALREHLGLPVHATAGCLR